MRVWAILFFIVLAVVASNVAQAQANPICQTYTYRQSTSEERSFILNRVKTNLETQANTSISSIRQAKETIFNCNRNQAACRQSRDQFMAVLKEQNYIGKVSRAIAEKLRPLRGRTRSPRSVGEIIMRMDQHTILPELIANFDIDGFHFSDEEKNQTLQVWFRVFVSIANRAGPRPNHITILDRTTEYFKLSSQAVLNSNPLLMFLNDENIDSISEVTNALDRLIEFNRGFLNSVAGLRTNHSTTFWSYLNLTLPDHEMGLVNFPQQISDVIEQHVNLWPQYRERDLNILCSALQYLQSQQRVRIRASIGIGFATAVVCGVGIWSGVAAPVALAYCSFNIADGLWGARRGVLDNRIARQSFYAGREILNDGTFTEGFSNLEQSYAQQNQAGIVAAINILGILPTGIAVATARAGARGTLLTLFSIPRNDVIGTGMESQSKALGYLLLSLRGFELYEEEFNNDLRQLRTNSPT